jgi:hypothetical protein
LYWFFILLLFQLRVQVSECSLLLGFAIYRLLDPPYLVHFGHLLRFLVMNHFQNFSVQVIFESKSQSHRYHFHTVRLFRVQFRLGLYPSFERFLDLFFLVVPV